MKHFLWIAVLALSACDKPASGPSSSPTPSDNSTPVGTSAPPIHTAPEPDPIQPRIYVTANNSNVPQIPAGWPLLLKVSLHAPPDVPLKVAAASGSWSALLHLTTPGATWKLKAVDITAPSITLDDASSGLLLWTMTAEELDAIPRGTYRIEALLDARNSPEGAWSGSARGSAAVVTLVPAIAKPTDDQEIERSRLKAAVLHFRGDAAGAELEADMLLKRFPKHTLAILLRVDLLEAAGKRTEAIAFLDAAIDAAVGKTPTAHNWPRALAQRREELAAMEKKE